ncbi:hypothetical protein [Cryptosporangium aurantiacum]|uniref:Secreted protein n=1 Tax=Cryptosporangium aurantiacum TaxID=134849 RepID=A0A1M7RDV6_9ACTN|nr:hypothetical protein [Cryptosporangium aurantiacum]SHN44361.1 hypothetical protein SAMN05443668_110178 [Cryptosporangium aurantiacum]
MRSQHLAGFSAIGLFSALTVAGFVGTAGAGQVDAVAGESSKCVGIICDAIVPLKSDDTKITAAAAGKAER